MTTRRKITRKQESNPMEQQHDTEVIMIKEPSQQDLEEFFTEPEPTFEPPIELVQDPPVIEKRRIRPPKTGKVFLGEEDIRHFEAYKKFLKDKQGIKDVKHKRI
jgi:hypothetical protein